MTRDHLESCSGVPGECPVPRVLVACEDPVLLHAVERVISWRRPHWLVDGVAGSDAARGKLETVVYHVVVVCIEVDSPTGIEILQVARMLCPNALRVAYSIAPLNDPEVIRAHERVTGAAAVECLVKTLDRVIRSAPDLNVAITHSPRATA